MNKKRRSSSLAQIENIDISTVKLNKYCYKELFEIVFANETDRDGANLLNALNATSKTYEKLTNVTFITYEEVINFPETKISLPTNLLNAFISVTETVNELKRTNGALPENVLAQLIKLKIIEVMYKQYSQKVEEMAKRKKLDEELRILSTSTKIKSKAKKGSVSKNSKKSSVASAANKLLLDGSEIIQDNTDISLEAAEFVTDFKFYDHTSFYILIGFHDAEVFAELVNLNVPVSAIIQINTNINCDRNNTQNELLQLFWRKLDDFLEGHEERSELQNTMLMKFNSTPEFDVQVFKDFIYLLRSIYEIKLNHQNYLRNLYIYNPKHEYKIKPMHCFETYNNALLKYPAECRNEILIFESILSEVGDRFETSENQRNKRSRKFKSFQSHDCDNLLIEFKFYKKICTENIYDKSLSILKTNPLVNKIKDYAKSYTVYPHRHDRATEFKSVLKKPNHSLSHLIHLTLLSSIDCNHAKPRENVDWKLNANLITNNSLENWMQANPIILNANLNANIGKNLYDPSALTYLWKESLTSGVLLQELCKAQSEFAYFDETYSNETDMLLIQFHDDLDEFGINVKTFEQTLRTPICLRDFCKYIATESEPWLKENLQSIEDTADCEDLDLEEEETCPGVNKIHKASLFPEYNYLLNIDSNTNVTTVDKTEMCYEDMKETVRNLADYNENVHNSYLNQSEKSDFIGYNFKPTYLRLTGARTIFQSHDDVKITIDNTRFIDEPPKCTVKLTCKNNSIVVHSSEKIINEDFMFHFNLEDGTNLVFFTTKLTPTRRKSRKTLEMRRSTKQASQTNKLVDSRIFGIGRSKVFEEVEDVPQSAEEEMQVISVDRDYFDDRIGPEYLTAEGYSSDVEEDQQELFNKLAEAVEENLPVYKINKRKQFLKKLNKKVTFPLSNVLNRLLHKSIEKQKCSLNKYKYVCDAQTNLSKLHSTDFRITLPNGLFIQSVSSNIKRNQVEVKQEYRFNEIAETSTEDYRIFTIGGRIVIKNCDGSMSIMCSNGDYLHYEKPTCEQYGKTGPCRCTSDLDVYRKKLNVMFKDEIRDKHCISRRASIKTQTHKIRENIVMLDNLFKLPYLKSSIVTFNGEYTSLENGKLVQSQKYYIHSEEDFNEGEVYYQRSDGFSCIMKGDGELQVQFADGSKITSNCYVEDGLVDGYVFVNIAYKFEHAHYATVAFNVDDSLEVLLNNDVVVKKAAEQIFSVKIGEDIETLVSNDLINFEKTCSDCSKSFICSMYIDNFYNQIWEPHTVFVQVEDSYEKDFYCDFVGNCSRNDNYINSKFNSRNCNHYDKMNYKKLFAVKRYLSGQTFWTDSMVSSKKTEYENDVNAEVTEVSSRCNIPMLEFRKNYYKNYCNRFMKENTQTEILYSTYTNISKLLTQNQLVTVLKSIDIDKYEDNKIIKSMESAIQNEEDLREELAADEEAEDIELDEEEEEEAKIPSISLDQEEKLPSIPKIVISTPKETIQSRNERMEKLKSECEKYKRLIRERIIPFYFTSEFYNKSL